MNETQIKALLVSLQTQRNNALNACAQLESTVAGLQEVVADLQKKLAALQPQPQPAEEST